MASVFPATSSRSASRNTGLQFVLSGTLSQSCRIRKDLLHLLSMALKWALVSKTPTRYPINTLFWECLYHIPIYLRVPIEDHFFNCFWKMKKKKTLKNPRILKATSRYTHVRLTHMNTSEWILFVSADVSFCFSGNKHTCALPCCHSFQVCSFHIAESCCSVPVI